MYCIPRFATMEVKNESTCEITVLWELFNEILSDIKGRDYKFNLRAVMFNENGTNYCAIQRFLGLILSHQRWSVGRCTIRMMSIGCPSELVKVRDLFKSICHEMCSIVTIAEYNEKKEQLDEITNIFPNITPWITWWDVRTYHMRLLLAALVTPMLHWPKVVILHSNATCNYGFWKLHVKIHL